MFEHAEPAGGGSFRALRRFAREATRRAEEDCDLCGAGIGRDHRHVLDLASRALLCVCPACAILFDRATAGGGTRRLVPARYRRLTSFEIGDAEWESLRIPVDMAFFTYHSGVGRVMALYPGPMGPTESLLALETWEDLARRYPILAEMEPDVEALLVNRVREAREYFLVPIDECYRLVGLIRLYWKGLSGGRELWQEIARYFADLHRRARPAGGADA